MSNLSRVDPVQEVTNVLLKQVPKNGCVTLLVDFNEQLEHMKDLTGKWVYGKTSENAESIIDILRVHDLFAVNTNFHPKCDKSTTTHLSCTDKGNDGILEGREVCAKYRGRDILGKLHHSMIKDSKKKWSVWFQDQYHTMFSEKTM